MAAGAGAAVAAVVDVVVDVVVDDSVVDKDGWELSKPSRRAWWINMYNF